MNHMDTKRKIETCCQVTHSCPECSAPVRCEVALGKSSCWCFSVSPQLREVEWDGLCMCASCLKGENTQSSIKIHAWGKYVKTIKSETPP